MSVRSSYPPDGPDPSVSEYYDQFPAHAMPVKAEPLNQSRLENPTTVVRFVGVGNLLGTRATLEEMGAEVPGFKGLLLGEHISPLVLSRFKGPLLIRAGE